MGLLLHLEKPDAFATLAQTILILDCFQANINLKIIMQRTKTTILFPDASDPNIPPIRKGSVTVTGMINNVYMARQLLVVSYFNQTAAFPIMLTL